MIKLNLTYMLSLGIKVLFDGRRYPDTETLCMCHYIKHIYRYPISLNVLVSINNLFSLIFFQ